MGEWTGLIGLLAGMLVVLLLSAFCSASEAALFYLRPAQRQRMARGTRRERAAARLLADPDRLLATILFCNLAVNLLFFSLSSLLCMWLEQLEGWSSWWTVVTASAALLILILLGELLPKTFGVLASEWLGPAVAALLELAVRIIGPLTGLLERINVVSQRVLFPGFQPEQYLEASDLERAIEISGADQSLVRQEQAALRNMVELGSIRVDEWMRPRTQFEVFQPPVSLADLGERVPVGGYLLVAEPGGEEIGGAVRLDRCRDLPAQHLEHLATPVIYLPWCATVADAMQRMSADERDVVVAVNEFGETIGVLTLDDILETVFTYAPSRSKRLLDRNPLHPIDENRWVVAGIMSLRQLARRLGVELPRTHSVTVAGVIQETMQRVAQVGDQCQWGPLDFRVIDIAGPGNMAVEMTLHREDAPS